MDTQGETIANAIMDNPFSLPAEDLLALYFWNFWLNASKFPPFDGVHNMVHETDWFTQNHHQCPGSHRMLEVYNQLVRQVS